MTGGGASQAGAGHNTRGAAAVSSGKVLHQRSILSNPNQENIGIIKEMKY